MVNDLVIRSFKQSRISGKLLDLRQHASSQLSEPLRDWVGFGHFEQYRENPVHDRECFVNQGKVNSTSHADEERVLE
jgi:hypothetical protein